MMENLIDYLGMGGYAGYVWTSYGVTAVILIAMLIASLRMLRSNTSTLETLDSETPDRKRDGAIEKKT